MNIKYLIHKSKKDNIWTLGNQVLYDLCKEHPNHKNDQEIIAKIWLIGRSYSASIERRRREVTDIINNDDYYIRVIQKIKKSKIDYKIKQVRDNKSNLKSILDCHHYLTNLFQDISKLKKRSLASKYLHFHLPEIFYIFDSRAKNSLRKLNKYFKIKNDKIRLDFECDADYSNFYIKSKNLVDYIQKEYGIKLNCREYDNLLIEIANNNSRDNITR